MAWIYAHNIVREDKQYIWYQYCRKCKYIEVNKYIQGKKYSCTLRETGRRMRSAKMFTVVIWGVGREWLISIPSLYFSPFSNCPTVRIFCYVLYLQNEYQYIITNLYRIVSGTGHKIRKNKCEYANFSMKETTFRINKSEPLLSVMITCLALF